MYDKLLGISSDKQCQAMVRSCGLAYAPEAYFNWNAEVLAITREVEWALLNYFIDCHIADGYEFILPPHMLEYQCGETAGQFPKFAD